MINAYSEDWSLKDKKFFGYDSEGKVFSSVLRKGNIQYMYNEDDIETLRQKLIEEIKDLQVFNYYSPQDFKQAWIDLLNKLFGVEK